MTKLNVKVFADGADIEEMKSAYKNQLVDGFTTNPSLMAKAGVTDYKAFAEEVVSEIPDASISFEVFADDLPTMEKEAEILKQLYEMDVHIEEIRGQRICLYYDEDTFDSLL